MLRFSSAAKIGLIFSRVNRDKYVNCIMAVVSTATILPPKNPRIIKSNAKNPSPNDENLTILANM